MAFRLITKDGSSEISSISLPGIGLLQVGKPINGSVQDLQLALDQFYPNQFEIRNDGIQGNSRGQGGND